MSLLSIHLMEAPANDGEVIRQGYRMAFKQYIRGHRTLSEIKRAAMLHLSSRIAIGALCFYGRYAKIHDSNWLK